MKVGVAGLGLIGGSLLRALGGVGYDADPDVRGSAAAEGFEVADSLGGLAGCELVLVAVPPEITYDVVREVLDAAPDAYVADTASVKGEVPELDRFVAAHPMAGSEAAGWQASSAGLLRGATWAACPSDPSLEPLLALSAAVDALGGRLLACDVRSHDHAVALTSHAPHVVATALALLARLDPIAPALVGTGFRDMTRVARADPALWASILSRNRPYVVSALDDLAMILSKLREALDDPTALEAAWRMGAAGLESLDDDDVDWRVETIDAEWGALQLHGLEGRPVRGLRLDDGVLHVEVAR